MNFSVSQLTQSCFGHIEVQIRRPRSSDGAAQLAGSSDIELDQLRARPRELVQVQAPFGVAPNIGVPHVDTRHIRKRFRQQRERELELETSASANAERLKARARCAKLTQEVAWDTRAVEAGVAKAQ